MYAFPRRWHLPRSVLSVGQTNTAEGQCVGSVALSGVVVYQARKRARESEHETVQRRASIMQYKAKKGESTTEQEHVDHHKSKSKTISG